MKLVIKIYILLLASIYILSGCSNPVEPVPDSEMCWFIGPDGLTHYYRCDRGGIGGGGSGYSDDDKIITVLVNLPDTTVDKYYGVFFITDTLTLDVGDERQGRCPNDTHFSVYCSSITLDSFYMAVLVSQNQEYPVKFEPQSGDYLGWYKGNGIYPGEKSTIDSSLNCSVYLAKIP